MAKSSKKISKSKVVSQNASTVKAPLKKVSVRKEVTKKSAVKNVGNKKSGVKKSAIKKPAEKKVNVKKAETKTVTPKKQPVKAANKINSLKKSSPTKVVSKSTVTSNKKAVSKSAMSTNETIQNNAGRKSTSKGIGRKNDTTTSSTASDTLDSPLPINHAVPAPAVKYAKPADPFHGRTAPVKGKSNISPTGKKPLWNK